MLCACLIGILAISGYVGADRQQTAQMTAAPVVRRSGQETPYDGMSFEDIRRRQSENRKQELSILADVIDDVTVNQATRDQANEQKLQIIECMEMETKIETALAYLGYAQTAAVYTQDHVMVILKENALEQEESVRVIDAVGSISGCEAKDIRIILAKK